LQKYLFPFYHSTEQVGTRPDGLCDMQPSWIITDYRLLQKRNVFAEKMYPTLCIEWAHDHFILG